LQGGRVAFELSRFEVVGDRCRVEGQWFGVRGRRFMRPALTVVVDGRPIRLLADLADKPWAAEDGEPWRATFPYAIERAQPDQSELTVAPDVTITLPAPEWIAGRGKQKTTLHRTHASRQSGARPGGGRSQGSTLTNLRDTERRFRQQLDRVEADRARTAESLDEASRELRAAMQQRDEANAARDRVAAELEAVRQERNEIAAERDTAVRERDRIAADREAAQGTHADAVRTRQAAEVARDLALSERDAALAAQREAVSERDSALSVRDRAVAERDAARSVRDQVIVERDAADAARDAAMSEREALSRTSEQAQSELADLLSARGAALVMRRAAQTPAVSRRYGKILPAAVTFIVVLAILLLWVILLRGF